MERQCINQQCDGWKTKDDCCTISASCSYLSQLSSQSAEFPPSSLFVNQSKALDLVQILIIFFVTDDINFYLSLLCKYYEVSFEKIITLMGSFYSANSFFWAQIIFRFEGVVWTLRAGTRCRPVIIEMTTNKTRIIMYFKLSLFRTYKKYSKYQLQFLHHSAAVSYPILKINTSFLIWRARRIQWCP